jgi:hypothetical protein
VEEVHMKVLTERYDEWEKKIKDFEQFLKKLQIQYKALRKQLKGLIEIKQNQIEN